MNHWQAHYRYNSLYILAHKGMPVAGTLVSFSLCVLQSSGPANLVKPSGRLEREVAPDLGLSGAAQLGIQVSSHQRPSSSQPAVPSQPSSSSRQAPAASQRSHSQPSTSGRCALSSSRDAASQCCHSSSTVVSQDAIMHSTLCLTQRAFARS